MEKLTLVYHEIDISTKQNIKAFTRAMEEIVNSKELEDDVSYIRGEKNVE